MNEQDLCKKRLIDLSKQANRKGIVLFSDFLNLNEQTIYHQCQNLLETKTKSFGGRDFCERQMIAFIPDALYYEWDYPITCLKAAPNYPKFADKLTHRDVLGALMNLGVERAKLGDIFVNENACYFFCEESLAPFFIENLSMIRHTVVSVEQVNASDVDFLQKFEEKSGIVTSNRLDSILACVYKLSRSKASELIRAEKVFVNGRNILSNTYICKEGDIVSVRGMGRFVYVKASGETQKGRIRFQYKQYL